MFKPKRTTLHKRKPNVDRELTMEENSSTVSMIIHGCKLAEELRSSLERNPGHVEDVAGVCDRIAEIFITARDKLRDRKRDHGYHHDYIDTSSLFNEWFVTQGMNDRVVQPAAPVHAGLSTGQLAMDLLVSARATMACSSSSSQRQPRKRRDGSDTRIVKMAAPQIGNIELPPDDGYTWRKYGQKEIMGKKHPRGYYRCTHQRQFNCPAKKQVQRDELDPTMFEVTYRGSHTCHLSATAPSTAPSSQAVILSHHRDDVADHLQVIPGEPAVSQWLSMEFSAGPSRGLELPVADLADVMFNSGSNSTAGNTMDFLFTSMEGHNKEDNNAGSKKASSN